MLPLLCFIFPSMTVAIDRDSEYKTEWHGVCVSHKRKEGKKGDKQHLVFAMCKKKSVLYTVKIWVRECVAAVGLCHVAKRKKAVAWKEAPYWFLSLGIVGGRGSSKKKMRGQGSMRKSNNSTEKLSKSESTKRHRGGEWPFFFFFFFFFFTFLLLHLSPVCNTFEWAMTYPVRKVTLPFPSLLSLLLSSSALGDLPLAGDLCCCCCCCSTPFSLSHSLSLFPFVFASILRPLSTGPSLDSIFYISFMLRALYSL
ncbi:hypothetical protein BKA57DRAFT_99308 [Linnemannia elongata]|nr:hypothetical protein BKA57DRAFT_99308 [Linnemannia elongata]